MLTLQAVGLVEGGRVVLDSADLHLDRGEIRVLVGASGAGKTSLLRVIAGLAVPTRGSVRIAGQVASQPGTVLIPPHERDIAMAFQENALWPHLSVGSHLRFGGKDARAGSGDGRPSSGEILDLVGLAGRGADRPGQLSGGERQRLGLARALAQRRRILLLDEPLAHIDLRSRRELATRILSWTARFAITALWVSHHPDELAWVGSRASLLTGGRVEGPFAASELDSLLR